MTRAILIVDDHLLIRLGLKQLLVHEFRDVVFGEAETAAEALDQLRAHVWRLVILDVSLPDDLDALSVLREVRSLPLQPPVLVLGMHADSQATRSLQLGASGCIAKSSGRSELLKAVSNVLDGKKHFGESVRQGVHSLRSAALLHTSLSAQEYKVLLALAAGRRTGEVAIELNLSAKTVSTYRRRILNKVGAESTAGLVRYVINHRLS